MAGVDSTVSLTPSELAKVVLTDHELMALDGQCRPEIQQIVEAARRRLVARSQHPDLPPSLAAFVADVVSEAVNQGRLIYNTSRAQIRQCVLCGQRAGYAIYKSGPRRGKPNYDRPLFLSAVELAHRSIRVEGQVALGGCTECVTRARPALQRALSGLPVQLPAQLYTPGQPRWAWHANRHCTNCGWEGHEGQMGRLRTLMNDGTYPAICPSCDIANEPLGRMIIGPAEGFAVVPA